MNVELTEQQLSALIELLNNSQFIGSSAEFIVELKQALQIAREK